jgi:hypothetical protein
MTGYTGSQTVASPHLCFAPLVLSQLLRDKWRIAIIKSNLLLSLTCYSDDLPLQQMYEQRLPAACIASQQLAGTAFSQVNIKCAITYDAFVSRAITAHRTPVHAECQQ